MPAKIGPTIFKILIGSLIVGLLLSFFDVSPRRLLEGLGDTALEIFSILSGLIEWAVQYILLGAVVIVPIWVIVAIWRYTRGKR